MIDALSENDTSSRRQHEHKQSRGGEQLRRRALAITLSPTGNVSVLSPLLLSLPKLSGILPMSPPSHNLSHRKRKRTAADFGSSIRKVDLQDGDGTRPILIQWSREGSIQILALPFTPDVGVSHKPVSSVAPVEIFHLPEVRSCPATNLLRLPGVSLKDGGSVRESVVLQTEVAQRRNGPVLMILAVRKDKGSSAGCLVLSVVQLNDGSTIQQLTLGEGSAATFAASKRSIVIALAAPQGSIHILDIETLEESHAPLLDICADPRTNLPVFALSDRMLAFTTSIPPILAGLDGLGSVVTAALTRPSQAPLETRPPSETLLSSAAGLGSEVVRGVWAGLKLGAKAASTAQSRLAQSVPVDGGTFWRSASGSGQTSALATSPTPDEFEEDQGDLSSSPTPRVAHAAAAGRWVVVIDLFPCRASVADSSSSTSESQRPITPVTIAHFALPRSASPFSPPAQAIGLFGSSGSARSPGYGSHHLPQSSPPIATPQQVSASLPISLLSFSPDGLSLLVAPASGRVLHVFEIRPSPSHARDDELNANWSNGLADMACGEVWERYQLKRGLTNAEISGVEWGMTGGEGQWIGVGTRRGTIHIYPICHMGGSASDSSHVSLGRHNAAELQRLTVSVQAIVRVRTGADAQAESTDDLSHVGAAPISEIGAPAFTFISSTAGSGGNPSHHDLAVFRQSDGIIEFLRMGVRVKTTEVAKSSAGSGLTEMMKGRGLLGRNGLLVGEFQILGRWDAVLESGGDTVLLQSANAGLRPSSPPVSPISYLAQAEIQSHPTSRRILPASVYLNKQIEFFAAAPVDIYSPLTVLDVDARIKRLVYRPDVEVRSSTSEVGSFDEPLSTALQSSLDARPSPLIPGLPNGQPSRTSWRKAIPIRHVAAGLGEGVDRVRREIALAQHSRQRRRASEAAGNSLSFDEQAVFASSAEGRNADDASSPGSMTHAPDSSNGADERSDEWEEGWEEEYQRAVDEDGPDDLILGLLDEEEDERRKWEQRHLALKQNAPPMGHQMPEMLKKAQRRKERLPSDDSNRSVAEVGLSSSAAKETHLGQ